MTEIISRKPALQRALNPPHPPSASHFYRILAIKPYCLLFALVLNTVSCKPQQDVEEKNRLVENGTLDPSLVYRAEEIGWKTSLPRDWDVTRPEDTAKMISAGLKAMEKTAGATIDTSGLKQLVNLKKDQLNRFLSTIEPFDIATQGAYADNQVKVKDLILTSFKNLGIKIGKVTDGKETLDGMEFLTLEIELLHPKTGAVMITQKMFSRIINGYDFAMTIVTNNDKDRAALMGVIQSSTFSKRH